MDELWVKRTDSSSYFPPDFEARERSTLEALPGVRYLGAHEAPPPRGRLCLLTNTHTRLSHWLPYRERVELILHPNSGFDNLIDEVESFPVPCVLGNSIRAQAVAQWSLAALLQHHSPLKHFAHWPASRHWDRALLGDLSILVVGLGEVGRKLFRAIEALGAAPRVYDPFLGRPELPPGPWDAVILCCSLNPGSRGMVGAEFLRNLSPRGLLINPARGELVDEPALRTFLRAHPEARAYLDVHAREPYPAAYWKDCPQVIASPHVAGVWSGLTESMIKFTEETLLLWRLLPPEEFLSTHRHQLLRERRTAQGWYR